MTRKISKEKRRAEFIEKAGKLFDEMEAWYDKHPEASFGEIETKARHERRELMGETVGILINGRDSGALVERPRCSKCKKQMEFEGYRRKEVYGLEGDTVMERAYYVCPECKGETIFPLGS